MAGRNQLPDFLSENIFLPCGINRYDGKSEFLKKIKMKFFNTFWRKRKIASSIFLSIFLAIFSTSAGQTGAKIYGKVTDADTGEPLYFVNVFLANTTVGSTTDQNGNYEIENPPQGGYDLIFSHITYQVKSQSVQIRESSALRFDAELELKIFRSSAVQVVAEEPRVWRKHLHEFQKMFLGETENAQKCILMNPEVLEFKVDSVTREIVAYSDSELVVENHSLGYRIRSQLHAFRWSRQLIEHQVYTRFEPLHAQNKKESLQWQRNRRQTYLGSFKHFLSAFARKKLKEEGFDLYLGELRMFKEGFGEHIDPVVLYQSEQDKSGGIFKKLYFKKWLKVVYTLTVPASESYLHLASGSVFVDSRGNFLTAPIIEKAGSWSETRIADRLPLDFTPH